MIKGSDILLALDLGTTTGWAVGQLGQQRPVCGIWELPKRDRYDVIGARLYAFQRAFVPLFREQKPARVVMAERFRSRTNDEAASGYALEGLVRLECWHAAVTPLVQPENTVRKEVLGRGWGSTEEMKRLVMAWCENAGIVVPDHNAGDAAVLWHWTRGELTKGLTVLSLVSLPAPPSGLPARSGVHH